MTTVFNKSRSDFVVGTGVFTDLLTQQLETAIPGKKVEVVVLGNDVTLTWDIGLTGPEITTQDGVIATHDTTVSSWKGLAEDQSADLFFLVDPIDPTKRLRFNAADITTDTTRVFTMPDSDDCIVTENTVQTMSNKSLVHNTNNLIARELWIGSGSGSVSTYTSSAPSSGQVLTATSSTTATWQTPSSGGGVDSVSGGSTGLLPSSPTTGDVVLSGTVNETSGGTGQGSYTTGDILYSDGSNSLTKLGIGSSGQVLTVSGGIPSWQSGGGGSLPFCDDAHSSTLISTTSTGFILATGMTLTPPSGTYNVTWTASGMRNTSNNQYVYIRVFAGGSPQGSEMQQRTGTWFGSDVSEVGLTAVAKVTVNGSQAIEGRWRQDGGTGQMRGRSLIISQVTP